MFYSMAVPTFNAAFCLCTPRLSPSFFCLCVCVRVCVCLSLSLTPRPVDLGFTRAHTRAGLTCACESLLPSGLRPTAAACAGVGSVAVLASDASDKAVALAASQAAGATHGHGRADNHTKQKAGKQDEQLRWCFRPGWRSATAAEHTMPASTCSSTSGSRAWWEACTFQFPGRRRCGGVAVCAADDGTGTVSGSSQPPAHLLLFQLFDPPSAEDVAFLLPAQKSRQVTLHAMHSPGPGASLQQPPHSVEPQPQAQQQREKGREKTQQQQQQQQSGEQAAAERARLQELLLQMAVRDAKQGVDHATANETFEAEMRRADAVRPASTPAVTAAAVVPSLFDSVTAAARERDSHPPDRADHGVADVRRGHCAAQEGEDGEGGEEEGGQEGPVCSLRLVLPSNGTAPRASATPQGPLVAEVKAPAQLQHTGHTGQRRGGVGALRGEEDTAVWLVQQVQQQLDAAVTRMEAVVAASEQRMLGRIEALHARLDAVASDNHTASPKPSQ